LQAEHSARGCFKMESQGGICHKRQVCKVEGDEVHHGCLMVRMSFYCDKGN